MGARSAHADPGRAPPFSTPPPSSPRAGAARVPSHESYAATRKDGHICRRQGRRNAPTNAVITLAVVALLFVITYHRYALISHSTDPGPWRVHLLSFSLASITDCTPYISNSSRGLCRIFSLVTHLHIEVLSLMQPPSDTRARLGPYHCVARQGPAFR